ncbi:MAG: hypothetical protein MZU84_06270 [Sphingobacterium sp.]|nr:hypothetical protein [Sphingobacterium sp.]
MRPGATSPDVVFTHTAAKREALVRRDRRASTPPGRPVLVGTASVRESEELAAALRTGRRPLRASSTPRTTSARPRSSPEAGAPGRGDHLDQHGRPRHGHQARRAGRATSATAVAALGGLYVIGTNRHESLRIDDQLRGRAGPPGRSRARRRFFISLEDDLFERYGARAASLRPLPARAAGRAGRRRRSCAGEIAHGQRDHRGPQPRHPPGPLELLDARRHAAADRRRLAGRRVRTRRPGRRPPFRAGAGARRRRGRPLRRARLSTGCARRAALFHIDRLWADHLAWLADLREGIHLVSLGRKEPLTRVPEGGDRRVPRAGGRNRRGDGRDARGPSSAADGPVDLEADGLEGPVLDLDLSRQRGPARLGRRAPQGHERRLHVRGRCPLRPALRPDHPRPSASIRKGPGLQTRSLA